MEINTLRDIVSYAAESYGTQPAYRYKVKDGLEDKTFAEVDKDSQAVSRMIEDFGKKGRHMALIGMTSYPWIISYFGITNSGSVAVPIDAQLSGEAICELLNRSHAEMLFLDEVRIDLLEAVKKNCPKIEQIISFQAEENSEQMLSWKKLGKRYAGSYETDLDPEQLCTLLFTSGTTGKSKGVMLSHKNLTQNAISLDMKIPAGTVSMTMLPINHVYCLTMDIIKGLYIGVTSCFNDSIMRVQKNLKLFKPELTLMVPMIIESIYSKLKMVKGVPKEAVANEVFGGRLKTICSGGAYLNPDLVEAFAEYGITILQGYGMTECAPVISTNLPWHNKAGSVGKLMPNCEAKVVDEELWVRGSSVMMGYYEMPEETKETLEDGWLKTGDLGYVDEEGFVYLTGRKKNLIILANGENVSPEELENQLSKHDLVKEILVREKDQVIQAEIFPNMEYAGLAGITDVNGALQSLIDDMNKDMPAYKRIHSLIVRETEFEKTAAKKIKRF